jgi:hypothetical protein
VLVDADIPKSLRQPNQKWLAEITYIDTLEGFFHRRKL